MRRLLLLTMSLAMTGSVSAANLTIKAVDEEGRRIANFDAKAIASGWGTSWIRSEAGVARIDHDSAQGSVTVVVRGDGFATSIDHFPFLTSEQREATKTISMERGSPAELQLREDEGLRLPEDFVPDVFLDGFLPEATRAWSSSGEFRDFNMLNAKRIAKNRYSFRLPASSATIVIGVHVPGALRFFTSKTFASSDFEAGVLVVDIPRPGAIEATFARGETDLDNAPFKSVQMTIRRSLPSGAQIRFVDGLRPDRTVRVDDVAPGSYSVTVRTVPKSEVENITDTEINTGRFSDSLDLVVQPSRVAKAKLSFVRFDPLAYRGSRTAEIRLLDQEGNPATGRQVLVSYHDGHFGYLDVHRGKVPNDGVIRLTGITDRLVRGKLDPYLVAIDGVRSFPFRVGRVDGVQSFDFRLVPVAGDAAPDFRVTDLETDGEVRLKELRGRVVILEFWSTLCGPCQPAMDKLNTIAGQMTDEWESKVVVMALSVDDDAAVARKHVRKRGWTNLKHFWVGSKSGFYSDAENALGVGGIPDMFVVDRHGKIVWRGHPRDLELQDFVGSLFQVGE
ncbi:MAG: TlpA family protein disulfide reductase [Bythopirellula sp.]